jgi:hypothetical protein
MDFEPKPNDIVATFNPLDKEKEDGNVFIVRKATNEDKERFFERLKEQLGSGEEVTDNDLKEWYENPEIFLCIDNDEVTLVSRANISHLVIRDGETYASI